MYMERMILGAVWQRLMLSRTMDTTLKLGKLCSLYCANIRVKKKHILFSAIAI